MARLVVGSKINALLEQIIDEAQEEIVLFCPYFKLHDNVRDRLKHRKEDYNLHIIIIFGKNENNPSKSLNTDDFNFLKDFPFISIRYEKRLHAKYYANERIGLITSLNLHAYSQNNNIELGVSFETKTVLGKALNGLAAIVSEHNDISADASLFVDDIYSNAEKIFEKEPEYKPTILGFNKKYIGSKVLLDISSDFFKEPEKNNINIQKAPSVDRKNTQYTPAAYTHLSHLQSGFCIRTKQQIPFNSSKPLSMEAYKIWSEFSNRDYKEKFCHACGNNWNTSVRNPFCNVCADKD